MEEQLVEVGVSANFINDYGFQDYKQPWAHACSACFTEEGVKRGHLLPSSGLVIGHLAIRLNAGF